MIATLYLLSSMLLTSQTGDHADWLLTPRFNRAQELLYRGEYNEEALGTGTRFFRKCKLDSRLLVMGASDQELEIGALTLVRIKDDPKEGVRDPQPVTTRLDLAKFDGAGRFVSQNAKALLVPLDGPAAIELGFVTEVPNARVAIGKSWTVKEEGRPERRWEVVGTEGVNGITCVKLVGKQQSPDWDLPRADRVGWQRVDTVWIAPRQGIAQQLERIILRRDPGHDEPTHRLTTKYQLDSTFQYSADLYEPRRLEITQAGEFWDAALPLMANPARYSGQLETLLGRIDYHLQKNSETPYREAILRVKRRVEAAKRGEALVDTSDTEPAISVVTVGKPAPDFVAPSLTSPESTQLKQWAGKPMVMIFYNPSARSTEELLPFAQSLTRKFPQAAVVGMAMSDDRDKVQQQLAELRIAIPVLSGTGLYRSYGIETTPKMVVIDDKGLVRESYLGWGIGVQESVLDELQKCTSPKK